MPDQYFLEKVKKGVDKRGSGWYSNKAVGAEAPAANTTEKFVKKL